MISKQDDKTVRIKGTALGTALSFCLAIWPDAVNAADARNYPVRPLRLISPFAAGGGNDTVSRIMGLALSNSVGQPVVVDNRPGATTIIGMDIVAKSTPDGYTLIMASSTMAANATLHRKLPYDSIKDFAPISLVGSTPLIVVVHPSLPVTTISGLVTTAKTKPDPLLFASAGTGNVPHLATELFMIMAGVKLVHVPYKGSSQGINDLIAGRVSLAFSTAPAVLSQIRSGRLRAIAITSGTRSSIMPDLPTVAESGLPGYEAGSWYGVLASAGTAREIVLRLNAAIVKALATPQVKEHLGNQGVDPMSNTPKQFAAYLQSEIVKWAKVIKAAGIRLE